jgi:hypothetical protein
MKNFINKYNELIANNDKVNRRLIYGAVIIQSICTVVIISCSYFGGMRKGVDLTDAYYDSNGKEIKDE